MYNISVDNSPVKLKNNAMYYLIDALYINNIRERMSLLTEENIDSQIRGKIFPYTDTPFAKYYSKSEKFEISAIKDITRSNIADDSCFSLDTGFLMFINESCFLQFVKTFTYDDLVDSLSDIIDFSYWDNMTKNYDYDDIALIISEGENSKYEFKGGGSYKIT
jgi:hypothetical protein